MLVVAPLFATFYSEYLNSFELVNNRTSGDAWVDVQKL